METTQMIEWEDKFSVGISIIAEEHKNLIGILNKAIIANEHYDNTEETKYILCDMIEYARKHFSAEETYMVMFNFPEYQTHRKEHLAFTNNTVLSYHNLISGDHQIANEILEYLKNWLVNHIQVSDRKYVNCLNENYLNKKNIMEKEESITNEGRRILDRRKRFDTNYKGWQRRDFTNRRSQTKRRKSK
jgi:hemerythrin